MDKDKILQTIKQIPLLIIEKAYTVDIWDTEIRIQMHYNPKVIQTYVCDRMAGRVDGNGFFTFKLGINGMTIVIIMTGANQ